MLNSHFSSLSLAGVRRACPALKPDAADQVLLKNRAGFAAFSKGRAFHRCREQDRCAGDREAGSHPAGSDARAERPYSGKGLTVVAMPVSQDAFPRLIPRVISLVPRILLGFSHYLRVSDPRAAGGVAIRAWRTHRPCVPTAGMAGAWAVPGVFSLSEGLRPSRCRWRGHPCVADARTFGQGGRTGRASLQRG